MIQLFLPHKPQPCDKVRRAVLRLGFKKVSQVGSHEQYELIRDGKKFKCTIDCHRGQVSAKVVKSIVAQCGVSKSEFLQALEG